MSRLDEPEIEKGVENYEGGWREDTDRDFHQKGVGENFERVENFLVLDRFVNDPRI